MKLEFVGEILEIGEMGGRAQAPVLTVGADHLADPMAVQLGSVGKSVNPQAGREQAREWARHLYGKVRITIETLPEGEDGR
jgi:hypothetical protein